MKVKWEKRKKVINLQLTLIYKIKLLYFVLECFPDLLPAITLPTFLSFDGLDTLRVNDKNFQRHWFTYRSRCMEY